MSFGLSAADIAGALKLTVQAYKAWRSAPKEYADITRELRSMRSILEQAQEDARPPSTLCVGSRNKRREWRDLMGSCSAVATELHQIVKEHEDLKNGEGGRKVWSRIRLSAKATKDLKARTMHCKTSVTSFLSDATFKAVQRIEDKVDDINALVEGMPNLETAVLELRASQPREASVMTANSEDDTLFWRQFRRDLKAKYDLSGRTLNQYAPQIMEHLHELARRDVFGPTQPSASNTRQEDSRVRLSNARRQTKAKGNARATDDQHGNALKREKLEIAKQNAGAPSSITEPASSQDDHSLLTLVGSTSPLGSSGPEEGEGIHAGHWAEHSVDALPVDPGLLLDSDSKQDQMLTLEDEASAETLWPSKANSDQHTLLRATCEEVEDEYPPKSLLKHQHAVACHHVDRTSSQLPSQESQTEPFTAQNIEQADVGPVMEFKDNESQHGTGSTTSSGSYRTATCDSDAESQQEQGELDDLTSQSNSDDKASELTDNESKHRWIRKREEDLQNAPGTYANPLKPYEIIESPEGESELELDLRSDGESSAGETPSSSNQYQSDYEDNYYADHAGSPGWEWLPDEDRYQWHPRHTRPTCPAPPRPALGIEAGWRWVPNDMDIDRNREGLPRKSSGWEWLPYAIRSDWRRENPPPGATSGAPDWISDKTKSDSRQEWQNVEKRFTWMRWRDDEPIVCGRGPEGETYKPPISLPTNNHPTKGHPYERPPRPTCEGSNPAWFPPYRPTSTSGASYGQHDHPSLPYPSFQGPYNTSNGYSTPCPGAPPAPYRATYGPPSTNQYVYPYYSPYMYGAHHPQFAPGHAQGFSGAEPSAHPDISQNQSQGFQFSNPEDLFAEFFRDHQGPSS